MIELLPNLRAVVLVGRHAAKAERYFRAQRPALRVLTSAHPSPLVRAKFPDRWNAIATAWAKVLAVVSDYEAQ
ncbi:MAG: hypothetical protein LAO06_14720 [Acidobacteriia bacterium]|nr:hypothetical protein [Terriglobia bacterium]